MNTAVRFYRIIRSTIQVLLPVAGLLGCARQEAADRLVLVGTTTHIESVVTAIGGDDVAVSALVPGGMCPGHFDLTPGHVRMLQRADLLVMHGFEQWARDVITAAGNGRLQVVRLQTTGNAMAPSVHLQLTAELRDLLCSCDSSGCAAHRQRAEAYARSVADSTADLKQRASALRGVPVACAEHQQALLAWLGCSVAVTYGRPDDLTPGVLGTIEDKARTAGALLVVDNLQSGAEAGTALATDIGARHVVLSNFPSGTSYLQTLTSNVDALLEGLRDDE